MAGRPRFGFRKRGTIEAPSYSPLTPRKATQLLKSLLKGRCVHRFIDEGVIGVAHFVAAPRQEHIGAGVGADCALGPLFDGQSAVDGGCLEEWGAGGVSVELTCPGIFGPFVI